MNAKIKLLNKLGSIKLKEEIELNNQTEIDVRKKKLILNLLRENIVKNIITLDISDREKRTMIYQVIEAVINDSITLFPLYKKPLLKRIEILIKKLDGT